MVGVLAQSMICGDTRISFGYSNVISVPRVENSSSEKQLLPYTQQVKDYVTSLSRLLVLCLQALTPSDSRHAMRICDFMKGLEIKVRANTPKHQALNKIRAVLTSLEPFVIEFVVDA